MSVLRLLAGLAVFTLAVLGIVRLGLRRSGEVDLGSVSDQWRAHQRASPNDSIY